ncbi:hypothetical protein AJ87_07580 [Rhizobium yanglingense]|nr:hypothetical protein AJ87_07580 [Rhizobium yanglingense]
MKKQLSMAQKAYKKFLGEVWVRQIEWIAAEASYRELEASDVGGEFLVHPCMNSELNGQAECVVNSGTPRFLWVYLPKDAAEKCVENRRFLDIPSHMGEEVVATDIPPYRSTTPAKTIVKQYHDLGWDFVNPKHIEAFLLIVCTDMFQIEATGYTLVTSRNSLTL